VGDDSYSELLQSSDQLPGQRWLKQWALSHHIFSRESQKVQKMLQSVTRLICKRSVKSQEKILLEMDGEQLVKRAMPPLRNTCFECGPTTCNSGWTGHWVRPLWVPALLSLEKHLERRKMRRWTNSGYNTWKCHNETPVSYLKQKCLFVFQIDPVWGMVPVGGGGNKEGWRRWV
jgi:hypothetical protein